MVLYAYPPYGFVTFAMLTLSSYMIILGLYSTAVSISQDIRLRQYIKDLSKSDSGFLNTIGQAQMEKQVQTKASDLENVVKEQRMELEEIRDTILGPTTRHKIVSARSIAGS
jgi:hypothetical protein